jgi:hypothetical protein
VALGGLRQESRVGNPCHLLNASRAECPLAMESSASFFLTRHLEKINLILGAENHTAPLPEKTFVVMPLLVRMQS